MSENTGATGANSFPIKLSKLQILVTEEDIKGTDILAMSDFFDGYVEELTRDINDIAYLTDFFTSITSFQRSLVQAVHLNRGTIVSI